MCDRQCHSVVKVSKELPFQRNVPEGKRSRTLKAQKSSPEQSVITAAAHSLRHSQCKQSKSRARSPKSLRTVFGQSRRPRDRPSERGPFFHRRRSSSSASPSSASSSLLLAPIEMLLTVSYCVPQLLHNFFGLGVSVSDSCCLQLLSRPILPPEASWQSRMLCRHSAGRTPTNPDNSESGCKMATNVILWAREAPSLIIHLNTKKRRPKNSIHISQC